jgi:hypothetical protein
MVTLRLATGTNVGDISHRLMGSRLRGDDEGGEGKNGRRRPHA